MSHLPKLPRRFAVSRGVLIVAVAGALLLLGGLAWRLSRVGAARENPLLSSPTLALEAVPAGSVYFNGIAWPWIRDKRPDLLPEEERGKPALAIPERIRSFAQAVQNPMLFRQLDRQYRFDTLLLVGDPSQYRPLLDHLLEARDFFAAYVDHTSVIFRRGSPDSADAWKPAQLEPVRAHFAGMSKRDQAIFLAQTAGKLVAIRQGDAAQQLLHDAEALDPTVADLWSARAQYSLSRGNWAEALSAADHALEIDRQNLAAMAAKAQALYSTKRFNEAYAISHRLVLRLPEDPGMLFYHAKIAHEAHAFGDEADVLRRLIALAEKDGRPTSGYRVYLGQALASSGEAQPALEAFHAAMSDPDLPKDQRAFALDCIALIKQRTGIRD